VSGLAVAAAQIECGRAHRVLLIGADFVTRITDWSDRRTAPLFGDGAGAVVLGPALQATAALGPIVLGSDGAHGRTIVAEHADRRIRMDGPEVFRHAVQRMGDVTVAAAEAAGSSLKDIDLFVYHQANARITRALGERLDLPAERVVDCIATLGNSSSATVPVALQAAREDGRLRPGVRVLVAAFGAGFTWGAGVLEWGALDD